MIIRGSLRENILYGITETIPDSEIKKEIDNFKLFDNNDIDLNDSVSNKNFIVRSDAKNRVYKGNTV